MTVKKDSVQAWVKGSESFHIPEAAWAPKSKEIVGPVDARKFIFDVVSTKTDVDVTESTISGTVDQTIEGASTINIVVHDFDRSILRSGVLSDGNGHLRTVDVSLDGSTWRLVKFRKDGDDLTFLFQEREVSLLQAFKGPRKARRLVQGSKVKGGLTRAQFVLSLIRRSRKYKIKTSIPELNQVMSVASATSASKTKDERDSSRKKGFPSGGVPGVEPGQLANIEVFMIEAERENAPERAILAGLVAGFGESGWSKAAVNGTHRGVFQSDQIPPEDLKAQSHHFLVGGRSFRAGGAIKAARDNPSWSIGLIASKTEISDADGTHYDAYRVVARRVLKAWGGAPSGGGSTTTRKAEFTVGEDEDYWAAIVRMAGEVGRRAFIVMGVFHWISEEDLFKSRIRYAFSENTDGVDNIDFDWDYGKSMATATVNCRIDQWAAPPGTVVQIDDLGPLSEETDDDPASRSWLVSTISRDLFSTDAVISLKKPMKEQPEPADEESSDGAAGGSSSGSSGGGGKDLGNGLSYPLAAHGKNLGGPAAHGARAWGNWQSDNAVDIGVPIGTEVYAVCTGKVVKLGGSWKGGTGNPDGFNITLSGGGRQWFYTHLKSRHNLTVGQTVTAGDLVGISGAANGVPHLHIGVDKGDPVSLLKV